MISEMAWKVCWDSAPAIDPLVSITKTTSKSGRTCWNKLFNIDNYKRALKGYLFHVVNDLTFGRSLTADASRFQVVVCSNSDIIH